MKLEHQVCSLEHAKRLKELGVKQESVWYYISVGGIHPSGNTLSSDVYLEVVGAVEEMEEAPDHFGEDVEVREKYAAFTVAELGEMLPADCLAGKTEKKAKKLGRWVCAKNHGEGTYGKEGYFLGHGEYADTEADARAKMLIYLVENNLITP